MRIKKDIAGSNHVAAEFPKPYGKVTKLGASALFSPQASSFAGRFFARLFDLRLERKGIGCYAGYVRKDNDAKNPKILRFFFVSERMLSRRMLSRRYAYFSTTTPLEFHEIWHQNTLENRKLEY